MLKDKNIIKKKNVDLYTLCANECFMKGIKNFQFQCMKCIRQYEWTIYKIKFNLHYVIGNGVAKMANA